MNLTGADQVKLANVLARAFVTYDDLNMVAVAALDTDLGGIAPPTLTLKVIAFRLVQWINVNRAADDILKLVETARAFVPDNPDLNALATYIAQQKQQAAHTAEAGAPERILHRMAGFVDVLQFHKSMQACENSVCRIELEKGLGEGTGFLVQENLVLTNYHVFDRIWKGDRSPGDVVFRFDYKLGEDRVAVPSGRECTLAPNWKVAFSVSGEGTEELDFVLLRLNESPAKDSIPNSGATQRSYLQLTGRDLEAGEPLVILQHPLARPMQLAFGSVRTIELPTQRIVHDVNTEPGSSGSPCFDGQWKPVALHYYGSQGGNRAILLGPILNQIKSFLDK